MCHILCFGKLVYMPVTDIPFFVNYTIQRVLILEYIIWDTLSKFFLYIHMNFF